MHNVCVLAIDGYGEQVSSVNDTGGWKFIGNVREDEKADTTEPLVMVGGRRFDVSRD